MEALRSWIARRSSSRGTASFLLASLVLGVLVGFGAAALVGAIELVRRLVDLADDVVPRPWLFVVSVPVGMLVSWLLDRRFGPGVAGGGVSEVMTGLTLESGYLPTRLVPTKIAATAATIGSGGSGGREGPIVLIGGAIGSSFARYTRFGQDQIRSLVAAGAGAGIGASFNAPIAGMLFAMEVVLQSFAVRHLNAVVVVSVAAAVTAQRIVGDEPFLRAPPHRLEDPRQLVLFALLGLLAVVFGYLFLRVLRATERLELPPRVPQVLRPLLAGVVVGLLGAVLAAGSTEVPPTLGTGQEFLGSLLRLETAGEFAWWTLFLIAAMKAVTAAITHGSGGSVGSFMPSMVVGGAIGAGFAQAVAPFWTASEINVGAFAVVGMAATLAVVARAPMTSIILVFEITGNYELVLPLMLATVAATVLADRVHPDNAYQMSLKDKGIHLPKSEDIDLLDTVTVGDAMSQVPAVAPSMTLAELARLLEAGHHHGLPVVEDGRLVGIVTLTDIERFGGPREDVSVGEAMTPDPITVTPSMPVSAALARMASLGIGRMPVVDEHDPRRLLGMFRRESVVRAYHHALGTTIGRELYRERVRLRRQPGTAFFEIPIRRGSPLAGRAVREIRWPDGSTLVSVRRGASVIIPHGSTLLHVGDVLTLFGTGEAREEVAAMAEPSHDRTGEWLLTPDEPG
ncbi:MAG TPA: CBS domain-containing protein [Actinobacteria bacterium]|nr:CBS domain-containing protein [Actinomycetota bacterium]